MILNLSRFSGNSKKYLLQIFQYLNIHWQSMFDNRNLKIQQQK